MNGEPPVATLPVRNGIAWVWAVWALKPGEATLVALCSSEGIAERYREMVAAAYPGAVFHAEEAPVDHAFAETDIRSVALRAASKWVRERKQMVGLPPRDVPVEANGNG